MKEVGQYMNRFAKYVVQQSRSNLTKGKKNSSKALYNSIGYEYSEEKDGFSVTFSMEDYGIYQDQGVKGAKSTYSESIGSPFKYTGRFKMIPIASLDKWAVKRNLRGTRRKDGKFISRKSLKYAIATSIYNKGIKASLFFTKPFEKAFSNLPKEILEAYSRDIEIIMNK
jgi:hypothetical protein